MAVEILSAMRRCAKSRPEGIFTSAPQVTSGLLLSLCTLQLLGCGSGGRAPVATSTAPATGTTSAGPLTYLAPLVAGSTNAGSALPGAQIYVIDDTANTFTQSTYQLNPPFQEGAQIINAGVTEAKSGGLLSLGITANYTFNGTSQFVATTYTPPLAGGVALELAGRGGGLVQLPGQPVTPVAPTSQCPTLSTPQAYQFLTIPGALITPDQTPQPSTWNPITDTAWGTVDISTKGSGVTLDNIKQFTLPWLPGTGLPASPGASSITGACGPSAFGSTISVPAQVIVTTPGAPAATPAQAIVAIGQTGLLVEDNGASLSLDGSGLVYQNSLDAGTGAVGLPEPSAAVDTAALLGARYLGFVYGAGAISPTSTLTGWSSHLAAFGFSSIPAACGAVAAATSTLIYGGDLTGDDSAASGNGIQNCDLALDLGAQDPQRHGLYPHVTVTLGGGYAANTTGSGDTFPAIALAAELGGKYVVFVLGLDASEPWAIYLSQSN